MNNAKIEWDGNYNTLTMTIDSKNYYLNSNNDGYFFGWDDFGNRVSCIREDNGNYVFINEAGQITNYNQYGNVIEENIVYSEKVNNFLYGNYVYEDGYGSVVFYKNGMAVSEKYSDGSIVIHRDKDNSYYLEYLNNNLYICDGKIVVIDESGNYYSLDKDNKVVCYDENFQLVDNYNPEVLNQYLNGEFTIENPYHGTCLYQIENGTIKRIENLTIGFFAVYENGVPLYNKFYDGSLYIHNLNLSLDYVNDGLYVCGRDGIVIVDESGNYYLIDKDNKVVCYDKNFQPVDNYNPDVVNEFINKENIVEDAHGNTYCYKGGKLLYTKHNNGCISLNDLDISLSFDYSQTNKNIYNFYNNKNCKTGKCIIDEFGNYCLKYSDDEYYVYDRNLNLITDEGKYSQQIISYLFNKIYFSDDVIYFRDSLDTLKEIGDDKFEIVFTEYDDVNDEFITSVLGNAYRDKTGNYILLYDNGDTKKINPLGLVVEQNINGVHSTIEYNKELNRKIINYDDRYSVSNINCINFDEEKYYEIIKLLKNDYNKKDVIVSDFNKINQIINNAYDVLSNSASLENEINLYYDKIMKLSEIINYASLLYRGFDLNLKESLNQLIDDLFEDGETAYEKRYLEMIQDDLTINNDGIYEYDKDIDFKQLDSEMVSAIIEEKLMKEYNLVKISKEEAYKKYGNLDTFDSSDAYYAERTININGVDFDFVYKFNLENININPILQCTSTEKQINQFSTKYDNIKLLNDLSKKMVILCDWDDGYGGSWCRGQVNDKGKGVLCLHASYPVYGDNKHSGVLAHEMGHAVDNFVGDRKQYLDIVYGNYNNNQPMYMMYVEPGLNMYYDGKFAFIHYDEENPYIVVNHSKYYLNGNNNVDVSGNIYQLVSCDDAVTHCKETYAESMAYFFHNPGELLERLTYDETYRLVLDELAYFLESEYGEDISWYKEWQVNN